MKLSKDGLDLIVRALKRYKGVCQQNEILCKGTGSIGETFWREEIERTTVILQRVQVELEGKK